MYFSSEGCYTSSSVLSPSDPFTASWINPSDDLKMIRASDSTRWMRCDEGAHQLEGASRCNCLSVPYKLDQTTGHTKILWWKLKKQRNLLDSSFKNLLTYDVFATNPERAKGPKSSSFIGQVTRQKIELKEAQTSHFYRKGILKPSCFTEDAHMPTHFSSDAYKAASL